MHCLMNADVAIILEHKQSEMRLNGLEPKRCPKPPCAAPKTCSQAPSDPLGSEFLEAYKHVNQVSTFKSAADVKGARIELENPELQLAPFEVAQLGNLCPSDAEEARALIPSLNREGRHIDNSLLDAALKHVAEFQKFS